jgi:hypothetical protein
MTLSYGFRFQNPDSTATLNARLTQLVQRGVYWGGTVAPGVGMTVTVSPLLAVAYDGGTVGENATQTLVVGAGLYYIVLRAKYNAMGVPALPTLQWQALTAAAYAADPEINYLIVLATVNAAGPAVLATDISMAVRDEVTPVGRAFMRGVAANVAALPTTAPLHNVIGDVYFVLADATFYYWTGAAWAAFTSGSYNAETIVANHALVEGEIERRQNGSGVLSGPRAKATPTEYGASDLGVQFLETPAVANQIAIDSFAAVVNGHYVVTAAQIVAMGAAPVGPDRYDVVFLEVWRAALAVPETQTYERNPTLALSYTLDQATDVVEQLNYTDGTAGNNLNFHQVGEYAHAGYAVRWRISAVASVPASALYDPFANAVANLAQNVDGNFFTGAPGSGDQRLWSAASATSLDGESHAIPLFVVRRTALEVVPNAIQEFRSGVRFVFSVYPMADVGKTARDLTETSAQNSPLPLITLANSYPAQDPSGWLAGQNYDVQAGAGINTIRFYESGGQFKARIRGFEDWIAFDTSAPSLGAAPALANQWNRTLVYLKLSITLHANQINSANNPLQFISPRHRPLLPNALPAGLASLVSQGWKRGFVTWEVVVASSSAIPGLANVLDEDDAMTAAGWTRGDLYVTGTPFEFVDGGVWSRAVAIGVDDRVHPFLTEWAIPICLVHRRNQAAWTLTNPNGGLAGTRPDGHTHDVIDADTILDLRRDASMTESEAKARLEADVDQLMTGRLRTRMAERWALGGVGAHEVAGTRILQADIIGVATPGCFDLKQPDGERMIWSDAREFDVVARSFANNVVTGPGDLADYNPAGPTLTVRAPVGAHLVKQLPAFYLSTWDITDPSYLHFESTPCWSTRTKVASSTPLVSPLYPSESEGKYIPVGTDLEAAVINKATDMFATTVLDAYGHSYTMEIPVMASGIGTAGAGSIAALSWWVHYDRDPSAVDWYDANHGLAEIPDVVHSAEWFDGGAPAHPTGVGTLYVVVRKQLVAAVTTTISLADVDAVKPANVTGATDKLIGISAQFLAYSTTPPVAGVTLVEMDLAQANITITWGAVPWTGYVDIVVFYETAATTTWIEVGRGGKSVRALFEWSEHTKILLANDDYAWDIGSYVWQHAEVADQLLPMPIIWKENVGTWELQNVTAQNYYADYPLSNLISLTFAVNEAGTFLTYVPARRPLGATETVTVHYTYTPYQGLSSTGGAVATASAAVAKLKPMLHGTVVDNTDFFALQSGPCSVYGGVETWCGSPARQLPLTTNERMLTNGLGSRFSLYNATGLVSQQAATGTQQLSASLDAGEDLTAAALLRLPFPTNPLMVTTGTVYHSGTEDYDLDPGREGASAGFFSYAIGYPSGFTSNILTSTVDPYLHVRYKNFVNGLTQLSITGQAKVDERSYTLLGSDYVPGSTTSLAAAAMPHQRLTSDTNCWDLVDTDVLSVLANLRQARGQQIYSTHTKMTYDAALTDIHAARTTGLRAFIPYAVLPAAHALCDYLRPNVLPVWTSPDPAVNDVLICTAPGAIVASISNTCLDTAFALQLDIHDGAGGTKISLYDTLVLIGSQVSDSIYGGGLDISGAAYKFNMPPVYQPQVDVVRFPLVSHGAVAPHIGSGASGTAYGSGHSSLKGAEVAYPTSWSAASITAAEALWAASTGIDSTYGRGIYVGNTTTRYCAPVMVPGSGTPLFDVLASRNAMLPDGTEQAPVRFPVAPGQPLFATSNRRWITYDHGGQAAYVGLGMLINPSSDQYQGRLVLQFSGGPVGKPSIEGTNTQIPEGTALDAFWPTGRPILTQLKKK